MNFKRLTDTVSVSPQITSEAAAQLADAGFTAVINNRPDGEMFGQPTGAEIETAARDAGLAYTAIPVAGAFPDAAIEAFEAALDAANGPVLAYCRSGMRSTCLWALASVRSRPIPEILQIAADAGYDLSGLEPQLMARANS